MMWSDFTITETENEMLPNGEYKAVIRNIEEKTDKYGDYICVEEEILDRPEYYGRIDRDEFRIGSDKEEQKKWAIIRLSKFFKQLLDFRPGQKPTKQDIDSLIGKAVIKTIEQTTGRNGKVYQNTVLRKLCPGEGTAATAPVAQATTMYGSIGIPQTPAPTYTQPMNDEVPF